MPKICVVQINVTDMDLAIDFYCNNLGFEVKSKQYYPDIVRLDHEGFFLLLYRVSEPAHIHYPHVAQTMINIQTDDLAASLRDLKSKGAELIHETPQACPAGIYAAFRDPFGNVHELLEFR